MGGGSIIRCQMPAMPASLVTSQSVQGLNRCRSSHHWIMTKLELYIALDKNSDIASQKLDIRTQVGRTEEGITLLTIS